tara:strand:+ start:1460 stop:2329 length:870 start_codon:yes stop_codon:yes gene_type:complete
MLKILFPWWLKIFVKIILSRLPIKYSTWRSISLFCHSASNVNESATALKIIERYLTIARQYISLDKSYNCLELGPGDSIITSLAAKKHGASQYWLVDTNKFARTDLKHLVDISLDMGIVHKNLNMFRTTDDFLKYNKIEYKTDGIRSYVEMPDSSIDLIWSKSVLEHIHLEKFESTLKELHRVLKSSSVSVHSIDFRDHLSGGINSLRFSKNIWESYLFRNSGFYTNRLRPSQMINLFSKNRFEVSIFRQDYLDKIVLPRNRLSKDYRNLSNDDLRTTGMILVAKAIKK